MIEKLEKILNVKFNDQSLLIEALTHSSYAYEENTVDNERLEFLGDAVLQLAMSNYLIKNFNSSEGDMTKKRAQTVCEEALAHYGNKIDLPKFLLLGKGEELSGGRSRDAIIADAFEAVLGAIYLDQGFEKILSVFDEIVVPNLAHVMFIKDYKSTLQELVQADKRNLTYEIEKEEGPAHNKKFVAIVYMDNIVMGRGIGKTKKEAEQNAAKETLLKVAKN